MIPEQPADEQDIVSVPCPEEAVTQTEVRQKYIDDQIQGEVLKLKDVLQPSEDGLIGPRTFHDRNGLTNTTSTKLQNRLNHIDMHTKIQQMKVNAKKTKIMPFNFSRKYDFIPNYNIDGQYLDVVYEAKLLGLMIRSDCKWSSNTKYITDKAKARLWFLRRLKLLGASQATLVEIFKLFLRSAMEMAVPVWSGAITCAEINKIERVQKTAVKLILGNAYTNYDEALVKLDLDTLQERRDLICLKFAKRCTKNHKFKSSQSDQIHNPENTNRHPFSNPQKTSKVSN